MPDNTPMAEPLTPEQEEGTRVFLKTNGPPAEIFHPDVPAYILDGEPERGIPPASKREKYLLEMVSIGAKQNEYLIREDSGKKMALRKIDARLIEGDQKFEELFNFITPLKVWREKWLSRRKMLTHFGAAVFSGVILAGLAIFLGELALEWVKRHLGWK